MYSDELLKDGVYIKPSASPILSIVKREYYAERVGMDGFSRPKVGNPIRLKVRLWKEGGKGIGGRGGFGRFGKTGYNSFWRNLEGFQGGLEVTANFPRETGLKTFG